MMDDDDDDDDVGGPSDIYLLNLHPDVLFVCFIKRFILCA